MRVYFIDSAVEASATIIHSESSIKTAKERRQRLRKAGVSAEEDFISLSVTRREDIDQGPHPESRLVREEDELGEGDDGSHSLSYASIASLVTLPTEFAEYTSAQERIALGKKARKKATTERRNAMQELIADAYVTFPFGS